MISWRLVLRKIRTEENNLTPPSVPDVTALSESIWSQVFSNFRTFFIFGSFHRVRIYWSCRIISYVIKTSKFLFNYSFRYNKTLNSKRSEEADADWENTTASNRRIQTAEFWRKRLKWNFHLPINRYPKRIMLLITEQGSQSKSVIIIVGRRNAEIVSKNEKKSQVVFREGGKGICETKRRRNSKRSTFDLGFWRWWPRDLWRG